MDDADGDRLAVVAPGLPVGHLGENAHGFEIEGFFRPFQYFEVGDIAVGIYHKTACDATFDTFVICLFRILASLVDKSHEGIVAAGKLRFYIDIIKFKHFLESLTSVGIATGADTACLGGSL